MSSELSQGSCPTMASIPKLPPDEPPPSFACTPGLITVDFVSLPPSDSNTLTLTVVDWFSKSVHFIPLVKLPSALETANLLVQRVFCLHGMPQDPVQLPGVEVVFPGTGGLSQPVLVITHRPTASQSL